MRTPKCTHIPHVAHHEGSPRAKQSGVKELIPAVNLSVGGVAAERGVQRAVAVQAREAGLVEHLAIGESKRGDVVTIRVESTHLFL